MLFRARKLVAVFLMAAGPGLLGAQLLDMGHGLWRSGYAAVMVVLLLGTVPLARGVWWGRMLPLAWSTSGAIVSAICLVNGSTRAGGYLAGALVLRACLAGREMFAHYEGMAPPPADWTAPGMRFVRAALLANLAAFLGAIAFAPAIHGFNSFEWHHPASGWDPTVLLLGCLAMTAVMLAGLLLLARQRTAGLFLVAVAAAGVPLILLANRGVLSGTGGWIIAGVFGPGVVWGWVALARFLPGMVRFVRR
jgi:hypothetical protein